MEATALDVLNLSNQFYKLGKIISFFRKGKRCSKSLLRMGGAGVQVPTSVTSVSTRGHWALLSVLEE